MIATDPLSLVFIACVVFAGAFIVLATLLGMGHGHGLHLGGSHGLHIGGHGGMHLGGHGHGVHLGGHGLHTGGSPSATVAPGSHAPPAGTHVDLQQHGIATGGEVAPQVSVLQALTSVNLNAVLVFVFAFGLVGYILHNTAHAGSLVAAIFAIVIGLVLAATINVLYVRLFGEESGRLGTGSSTVEGRVATVSIPIRQDGIGEVIFTGDNGTRKSLGARSANGSAIPRDADVVIVSYSDGIAVVESWDDFITEARA
jgi:membrane protein implicated in regulation of membrane protease activity